MVVKPINRQQPRTGALAAIFVPSQAPRHRPAALPPSCYWKYRGFTALIRASPFPSPPYHAKHRERLEQGRGKNMAEPTDKINPANPTVFFRLRYP